MTTRPEIRVATADEILSVRMAVLRPGRPVVPSDYDARPDTRHVGAFADGVAVGCASVFPEPYDGAPAWQLRGMAVDPAWQGTGVGAAVLAAAIEAARADGAPTMWAKARVSALRFYERAGFRVVGEEFVHGPSALPHRVIVRSLGARPADVHFPA